METTMNNIHPDTAIPAGDARQPNTATHPDVRRFGRPGDDVVRWAEFWLALWMGGLALGPFSAGLVFCTRHHGLAGGVTHGHHGPAGCHLGLSG